MPNPSSERDIVHEIHGEMLKWKAPRNLGKPAGALSLDSPAGGPTVQLPQPEDVNMELASALGLRRTHREFSRRAVSAATLSTLFHHANGCTGVTPAYGRARLSLRSAPSGGGLQEIDLCLIASNCEGLHPGIHFWQPQSHTLVQLDEGPKQLLLGDACPAYEWVAWAPAVVVLLWRVDRSIWKYGRTGYRLAHFDAGAVMENLYLVATGLGLVGAAVFGFEEDALLRGFRRLKDYDAIPMLLFPFGYPPELDE